MDVFSAEVDVALFDKVLSNTRSLAKPSLDEEVAERIVRNLLTADRPVLYVGAGSSPRMRHPSSGSSRNSFHCPWRTASWAKAHSPTTARLCWG